MRLLQRDANGDFSLVEFWREIPPYAILSHTWGPNSEEVSFKDIDERIGRNKPGFNKLRFCADQAAKDGLRYFWIDTCCIDKSSSAELSEATNSMFTCYRNPTRCYVYLVDILIQPSRSHLAVDEDSSEKMWKSAFRKSGWFTRGWTLQELLAPSSVDFFTLESKHLGSKYTLLGDINAATTISPRALQSTLVPSDFTIEERMSWATGRETKRDEDRVYSLLGLFGVHMPLLYGEGRTKALVRLY